jgi:UDP-N-acetylglucosamine 2-epimerase (non-hydrolysing)
MKVVSIVGARPQFIKAAAVSRHLRSVATEVVVHTGQHYDHEMSAVFFHELAMPQPDYNLHVGSGPHGWQTGQMLIEIEKVLQQENPEWVLVYGDTNSTLAGALAAVKLHIRLAHVEAGLRSYNRQMPEEHNRVLSDHAADLLLCPTQTAVDNLALEGIRSGVYLVGDVMYDAVLHNAALARERSRILQALHLTPGTYALATVHRPQNTDDPQRLRELLVTFSELEMPVLLPVHPRTAERLAHLKLAGTLPQSSNLRLTEPVGYLDMLVLEQHARLILTDSGGVQKEAYFFAVPCLTLREETEWVETVDAGWNRLVGTDRSAIIQAVRDFHPAGAPPALFGNGRAAEQVVAVLKVASAA